MLEFTKVSSSEVIHSLASLKFGKEYRFLLSQIYFKNSFEMIVLISVVQLYSP